MSLPETDPFIADMCEGLPDEPDIDHRVGKWPDAILTDVQARDKGEYGFSINLTLNLTGDPDKPKVCPVFLNLPGEDAEANGDAERAAKTNRINAMNRDNLASIMHAGGLYPVGKKITKVVDDEAYGKIVALFNHGQGAPLPVRVAMRKDGGGINVYGMTPKKK